MAAAPQAPGRGSVRKTRPVTVKTSLNNPYTICWSALEREDMHFILQTLEDRFKSIGLEKIEDKKRSKKQPFLKKQGREKHSIDVDMSEALEEKPEDNQQVSGWTSVHVRKQLAIGVNEVTRALERNELLLVLVCKSAKPAIITSHLIQLSLSRTVPACQVPRLSERIAPVIGLKCVLALGFKKNTTDFVNEVKAIIPRVPRLNVPWLQDRLEDSRETSESESLENQDKEILDTSFEDLSKQRKKPAERQQAVVLQPLKIKKLIPNPNKKRKPPKSKKTISK
ncbi:ribonuclease P protein subunit p38 [Pteronotus mesoamericanus]|uniref:ribonuclease P protein subunit p38 n=1 Tax=Pteronotus mesoamericanus TaxID=1884717 RepID=UPI0023EDDAC9|nr:ribonuclease P protein subunit p38 [Pteronotus parnellii mesoamericanus]XP_054449346.1 ribonuclease P protein subunit p38 [Pteronotus parnellii mesoamericanus]XP_054449355.1 ribonuclease P protein subunit p38 [Pteronotus parnellii mesoamericanus]XP_054449363.1 ribonuclease P protein subunit p38 [Pteronotus parnellii mesoamericanus]XP_054449374.1 ribonuclease P protein subunit p38 [Pteronotus parnellii mesoamericanus]XP_054449382.1 ribonuclease P protein subunit p38 [Pteronotus parnellii mes